MKFKRTRLRVAFELLCFVLMFAMLLCVTPLAAQEIEADAEEQTEDKPKTVDVVKILIDAPRGTWIEEEDLEVVTVKNENVPSNVISDIEEIVGMYTLHDLYAGEYVPKGSISESKVNKVNRDLLKKDIVKSASDYVIVTDYIAPNTGDDISYFLQQLIDANPKRTIYFPDGVYTIASPLETSAGGGSSVDIQLSDGAVIKAHANWRAKNGINSLIALGAAKDVNDIVSVGSYYTLVGGTLDGNNKVENGVSIDSGRESVIRNICIKNCLIETTFKNCLCCCGFTILLNRSSLFKCLNSLKV